MLEERHAEELFSLVDKNRAYLRKWLPWVDVNTSTEDTQTFIRGALQKFVDSGAITAGIWHRGQMAGVIGLHQIEWTNNRTDIGYWLDESHQGKGIMTRACEALVDHVFEELNLNRVEIEAAVENVRSRAIPERLGFTLEGIRRKAEHLYGRYVDLAVYGMVANEWRQEPG